MDPLDILIIIFCAQNNSRVVAEGFSDRPLIAEITEFPSTTVRIGFVVDKMTSGLVFHSTSIIPCQILIAQIPNYTYEKKNFSQPFHTPQPACLPNRKLYFIRSPHTQYRKYTGCNRRNGPDFGRVFLRSNYTDITQNTYIQSSMVTEILAREV